MHAHEHVCVYKQVKEKNHKILKWKKESSRKKEEEKEEEVAAEEVFFYLYVGVINEPTH